MSCYARFINDPVDESYVNSKLVWDERLDVGVAISAGSIDKGEEIYQHYSDSYWTSNATEIKNYFTNLYVLYLKSKNNHLNFKGQIFCC